jgi:hypothetical protein
VGRRGLGTFIRIGTLGVVMVAIAACSSSSSSSSRSEPSTTVAVSDADEAFIALVRSRPVLALVGADEIEWLDLGHEVCEGIHKSDAARGHERGIAGAYLILAQRSIVREWVPGTADAIMTTAIETLCPRYRARWEQYRATLP